MTGEQRAILITVFVAAVVVLMFVERFRAVKRWRAYLRSLWGKLPDRSYEEGDITRIAGRFRRSQEGASFAVDDITAADLDLDEIFRRLNYCRTSVGEEVLYETLRTPSFDARELEKRRRLADECLADRETTLKMQERLAGIGKSRRLSVSDCLETLMTASRPGIAVHVACIAAILVSAACFFFLPGQAVVLFVLAITVSLMLYYREKGKVAPLYLCMQYIARTVRVSGKLTAIPVSGEREALFSDIRRQCEKLASIRRFAGVLRSTEMIGGNPLEVVWDYVAMIFHADLLCFALLMQTLRKERAAAEHLLTDIGLLETAISTALWRASTDHVCVPELTQEEHAHLRAEGLRHPLLEKAVPNTIDTGRPVLLTGSNASGKSTFLKTAAVNAILAQTIGFVRADAYKAPFARVMSSMALKDSLVGGESYFMVELRSLKRILDAQGPGVLFAFVDEVLRGTNTVERIAASSHILSVLGDAGVLVFAATHDGELTSLLEGQYDNYHFEETIEDGDVRFSYELKKGPATSRNAIELLRVFGYGEEIVERSRAAAAAFEETGVWRMT